MKLPTPSSGICIAVNRMRRLNQNVGSLFSGAVPKEDEDVDVLADFQETMITS